MTHPYRIAVCHHKGGVAKTTTVSSLGACFAERGLRTLLIDLDPAANLTTGLGISPAEAARSAADILLGNERLGNIILETALPGLDIVPSNSDMITASRFLNLRPGYESLLANSFAQNGIAPYNFVLLDCPPSVGAVTITALNAADMALIPTQPEYYSLQALDGIFGAIKAARMKGNPGLRYRLLVTMYDRRGSLHTRVLESMQERLRGALLETMIGFDSKLRESQMYGVPITLHAPGTRAAHQYRLLAEEMNAYVEANKNPEPA